MYVIVTVRIYGPHRRTSYGSHKLPFCMIGVGGSCGQNQCVWFTCFSFTSAQRKHFVFSSHRLTSVGCRALVLIAQLLSLCISITIQNPKIQLNCFYFASGRSSICFQVSEKKKIKITTLSLRDFLVLSIHGLFNAQWS